MAAWQFHLQIVSKSEIEAKYNCIPETIGKDELEALDGWGEKFDGQKLYTLLSSFLIEKKSWSKEIKQWGKEDSNCFELVFDKNSLEEVVIRIDLRNFKDYLIDLTLKISNEVEGVIIINNRTFSSSKKYIMRELVKSDANKFIVNPVKYLSDLENEYD